MKYNKIRHLKLLKQAEDLEKQGKSLYKENREDYLELLSYQGRMEEHIFWKNRHQFFSVIENFINGSIDGRSSLECGKKIAMHTTH